MGFPFSSNESKIESNYILSMVLIQTDRRINPKVIDKLYADIIAKIDAQNNALKAELQKQRQAEEQERLRKIQDALEMERRQKAEEERRVKEEEENRKKSVRILVTSDESWN